MTGILLSCRRCGRQVYSSELADRLCLECRVDEALEDLRQEHVRLWRKRERYRAKGANADSIARQVARVEDRMVARIRGLVADDKLAAEHLKRNLERARSSRYDIRSFR